MEVRQRVPLPATGRVEQYNTSLFNASSSFAADYDIPTIISRYNERNGELLCTSKSRGVICNSLTVTNGLSDCLQDVSV